MSRARDRILALAVANLRASPGKSAVLLVGAMVLVFLVVRQVSGGAEAAEAGIELAIPVTTGGDDGAGAAGAASIRAKRRPMPRVRRTLLRNPFACSWLGSFDPSAGGETKDMGSEYEELTLQFTMKGTDGAARAIAVISGVVVHPGSTVAGYEVVSVGERHVVLRNAAEEITLRMP